MSNPFSIDMQILPFSALSFISIGEEYHYKMAEIADIQGNIKIGLCDWAVNGDAPILNIIETSEFLYELTRGSVHPVALTIDMEPVLYGWNEGGCVLITNFKSKELRVGRHENILGKLTGAEFGMALKKTVDEIAKVLAFDPFLYAYVLGRMYRQSVNQKDKPTII